MTNKKELYKIPNLNEISTTREQSRNENIKFNNPLLVPVYKCHKSNVLRKSIENNSYTENTSISNRSSIRTRSSRKTIYKAKRTFADIKRY